MGSVSHVPGFPGVHARTSKIARTSEIFIGDGATARTWMGAIAVHAAVDGDLDDARAVEVRKVAGGYLIVFQTGEA